MTFFRCGFHSPANSGLCFCGVLEIGSNHKCHRPNTNLTPYHRRLTLVGAEWHDRLIAESLTSPARVLSCLLSMIDDTSSILANRMPLFPGINICSLEMASTFCPRRTFYPRRRTPPFSTTEVGYLDAKFTIQRTNCCSCATWTEKPRFTCSSRTSRQRWET